jgi:uncharacterized protein
VSRGGMKERDRKQKPIEIEEVRRGTKAISSDPKWKYVTVRRRLTYLEEAIDKGTQWVVFEPNTERLWEAVDRTTMTQDDIENGRLILLVGVALVKPAEFVVFRIGQWTAGH